MRYLHYLLLTLLFSASLLAQGFRLYRPQVSSQFLKQARDIYVYFPKGFSTKSTKSYPVIFIHDGQNLYDAQRSAMGKTWNMENTLNRLIAQKQIPPLVVVAMDNSRDRLWEYTQSYDGEYPDSGGADNYLKFIVRELRPWLLPRLHLSNRPEQTAIMGSSLGGLVSLYAALKYPKIFGLVAALSPSLWWNNGEMLELFDRQKVSTTQKFYLDSGTDGGERPQDVGELARILSLQGVSPERQNLIIAPGAVHDELAWAKRLPNALTFLFQR